MKYKNYDVKQLIELLDVQNAKMENSYPKGWYKIWHQQANDRNAIEAELLRREQELLINKN